MACRPRSPHPARSSFALGPRGRPADGRGDEQRFAARPAIETISSCARRPGSTPASLRVTATSRSDARTRTSRTCAGSNGLELTSRPPLCRDAAGRLRPLGGAGWPSHRATSLDASRHRERYVALRCSGRPPTIRTAPGLPHLRRRPCDDQQHSRRAADGATDRARAQYSGVDRMTQPPSPVRALEVTAKDRSRGQRLSR